MGFTACSQTSTADEPISETGMASYYHNRYHGKATASGELYDKNKMTAAHPNLPFGTVVNVVLLSNPTDTVMVTINDRCAGSKGRIVDLSRVAAEKLGLVRAGLGKVHLFTE